MSITDAPPSAPATAGLPGHSTTATPRRRVLNGDLKSRAAGLGALGFATLVIVQNVLRSGGPQPGADIEDVAAHYADHRAVTVALMLTLVLSLCSLVSFLGGGAARLVNSGRRGWAVLGCVGA